MHPTDTDEYADGFPAEALRIMVGLQLAALDEFGEYVSVRIKANMPKLARHPWNYMRRVIQVGRFYELRMNCAAHHEAIVRAAGVPRARWRDRIAPDIKDL